MPFQFKTAFNLGYDTFKSRYGALLGAVVVYLLISTGAAALVEATNSRFLGLAVGVFFYPVFQTGVMLFGVRHMRAESPGLETLFTGFRRYWPLVAIGLVLGFLLSLGFFISLAGIIVLAVLGLEFEPILTIQISIIAMLGLALFVVTRLSFTTLLCLDPRHQLGIIESFKSSWRATGPVFWPLLALYAVLLLLIAVSTVLLVLPLIFIGLPLSLAVWSAAYELITSDTDTADSRQGEGIALHPHPRPAPPS